MGHLSQGRLLTVLPVSYGFLFLFQLQLKTLDGLLALTALRAQLNAPTGRSGISFRLTGFTKVTVF